jgi:hypothetical protein
MLSGLRSIVGDAVPLLMVGDGDALLLDNIIEETTGVATDVKVVVGTGELVGAAPYYHQPLPPRVTVMGRQHTRQYPPNQVSLYSIRQ